MIIPLAPFLLAISNNNLPSRDVRNFSATPPRPEVQSSRATLSDRKESTVDTTIADEASSVSLFIWDDRT